jgi:magnesium transporter
MAEIELSNRLYEDGGVLYLTTVSVAKAETDMPHNEAVTYIITGKSVITLRYEEIGAFKQYVSRLNKLKPQTHAQVFNGLVESTINRIADLLERIAANIDNASRKVFRDKTSKQRYEDALQQVGNNGDLLSKARESLMTYNRALTFAGSVGNREERSHIDVLLRDITALSLHADFLYNKAIFLLDATLGMINYEQNNIIKMFTIAALILMPPTLISSIYGMNFKHMPELHWHYGYPLILFIMLVSAFLPYRYFKKRGWI